MSLLNVYVILSYHVSARPNRRNPNKQRITDHQLDAGYVWRRVEELSLYHSDPIHWNIKELSENLLPVMQQTLQHHEQIEDKTGILLHSRDPLLRRIERISSYQQESRARSLLAQEREQATMQPGERTDSELKASINITNFFNGEYHLTVDEVIAIDNTLFLIEKKHSKNLKLPSTGDIKDGLLKLILYSNLENAELDGKMCTPCAILGLTSVHVQGWCHSLMSLDEQASFVASNPLLNKTHQKTMAELFEEANANRFVAYLSTSVMDRHEQRSVLLDILARQ